MSIIEHAAKRRALEEFGRTVGEIRRRQAKKEHATRGYRDANGVWCGGLLSFVRYFWQVLEPGTTFVEGWPIEAICEHLEAVSYGEIVKLLINVPPGFMKSLLTDVFWPAWEWSALGKPHLRYVSFSYSSSLTERDNGKFRDLITSTEFQAMYGDVVKVRKVGETKVTNTKHGWKLATSVGGVGTGERGDRVILDDPHNVKDSESERVRDETVRWFRESMSSRLNDIDKSAIVIIMQRVHESDVSGTILELGFPYEHLMIPMRFVWSADEDGEPYATSIGWVDPRWTEDPEDSDGLLAWPARFPEHSVDLLETTLGPYATAGQLQQTPEARGGGIIKRDYWQPWEGKLPAFSYIWASLDAAFTEDEQNDPSALTVWGVYQNKFGHNRILMLFAWEKWLKFEGERLSRNTGENTLDFQTRQMKEWGLVEWIAHTCNHWKVDKLLIEAKASGISAAQSLQIRFKNRNWSIELCDAKGDKTARAHAVQPTFSQGLVSAPLDRDWSVKVIDQCAVFPFGKHDDLHDSVTQAVKHARDIGLLEFDDDLRAEEIRAAQHRPAPKGLERYKPGAS